MIIDVSKLKQSMIYCQLDYPQELGTKTPGSETITIAMCGCALCSLSTMLANTFHKKDTVGNLIDPLSFNAALNAVNGFASNGEGDFDLIDWGAITRIFPDITLAFNHTYYNPPMGQGLPADMALIDSQLAKGLSVVVGVSFNHHPSEPTPTHYVELYKKNEDGTYQMRDPMFRAGECDTVFDHRYAVNGMNASQAILQAISYNGAVAVASTTPVQPMSQDVESVSNAYFKVGDTIKVDAAVPTGASPDAISFSYGQISATAPAKVTGYRLYNNTPFYAVDQTAIGGGTGYADMATVDSHAVKTAEQVMATDTQNIAMALTGDQVIKDTQPAETPEAPVVTSDSVPAAAPQEPLTPPTTNQTPEEKAASLVDEKTALVTKIKELGDKYKMDLEAYSSIVALGYTKAEEIIKHLEEVTSENSGLKKQLVQVLRRNKAYHLDMAAKEEEDATAIETGMKFEYLYKDIKNDLSVIAKVFKTTPSMNSIVQSAEQIRSAYEKVVKQLQNKQVKEAAQTAVQTAETINVKEAENGLSLLTKFLSFKG